MPIDLDRLRRQVMSVAEANAAADELERLRNALAYLERRGPTAIGYRRVAGETEYWVGGVDGLVYVPTLLEAIEKAAGAAKETRG